ncbi:MAG: HAD-IC family P-type ATPase, partial [Eubacteriales bacterium]
GHAGMATIRLLDHVRREAKEAVDTLHTAGVRVVMVTGDGRDTAVAIAREAGILRDPTEKNVIGGGELARLSDEELCERLPHLAVVYRALPGDKTRLVRAAQSLGLVTGMTGDGINDAPSLKLADVGFAMGSGTDIAREAGDIVILDDNIASITRTVLYGRTIFRSIRKFITFQLTMNFCAVGVSLLGQFIGIESPVTIIQMLWVNIIMDTLGGLAFAGEPPLAVYMRERPKKREEKILSGAMVHQISLTGAYTLILCIWFLLSPSLASYFGRANNETYFLTLFFALFIFCGLANCFCARSERMNLFSAIGRNRPFLVIMFFISCVQMVMIYFGGEVFRTTPVRAGDLALVILMSLTVIPADFIRRGFYRLRRT